VPKKKSKVAFTPEEVDETLNEIARGDMSNAEAMIAMDSGYGGWNTTGKDNAWASMAKLAQHLAMTKANTSAAAKELAREMIQEEQGPLIRKVADQIASDTIDTMVADLKGFSDDERSKWLRQRIYEVAKREKALEAMEDKAKAVVRNSGRVLNNLKDDIEEARRELDSVKAMVKQERKDMLDDKKTHQTMVIKLKAAMAWLTETEKKYGALDKKVAEVVDDMLLEYFQET